MSPKAPPEITYTRKTVAVNSNIRLDCLLDPDTDWVVWWYGGFLKLRPTQTQPNCKVLFRALDGDRVSHRYTVQQIPLTSLGHVRHGTIWRNKMCRREFAYETADLKVDFTKGSWKTTSFREASQTQNALPYPLDIHPLPFDKKDLAKLIEFPLETGGKLVIPCIEFFTRCYGSSAELKRIISTYPWEEALNQRLLAPDEDEPGEPGLWKVKLRRRLVNDDVTFLAHVKYDHYTELAAKSIYAQIETSHDPNEPDKLWVPQQNLWVNSGEGKSPSE